MARAPRLPAQWPSPNYDVGSHSFIHALGVISATYNQLEFQFMRIFQLYSLMPPLASVQAFLILTNESRITILRLSVDNSHHPRRIKTRALRFVDGFFACTQNRNILMHSETVPIIRNDATQEVQFKKLSKRPPFVQNIFAPSLEDLRKVADSTQAFQQFGNNLYMHIVQNFERGALSSSLALLPPYALPKNPDVPNILAPLPR